MTVAVPGVVVTAAVGVDITHTFDGDIDITLYGPDGSDYVLSSRIGSASENYTDTIFTDSAATPISSGSPPYTGSFRPVDALAPLSGVAAAGDWSVAVHDYAGGDSGTFNEAFLYLCVCTACEFGAGCIDGMDNDTDGLTDCADDDCTTDVRCSAESACADGGDSDLDGLTDCADDDCDGISTCEYGFEHSCADGIDNDADGNSDCDDSDCVATATCTPETSCSDGVDNDADTFTDCRDLGCNRVGVCEYGTEVSCYDSADNDGDGLTDCADANCNGTLPCQVGGCPAWTTPFLMTAKEGLPGALAYSGSLHAPVEGTYGLVASLAVKLDIVYSYDSYLNLTLESPMGTVVDLSTGNGYGANFTNTVFTDTATVAIVDSSYGYPYTGLYRPEEPLSTFRGETAYGIWHLNVQNTASYYSGSLNSWSVFACTCMGTSCEQLACGDHIDSDGDGLTDCDDPDCATDGHCVPEPICNNGADDDYDLLVDCKDPDCNGRDRCEYLTEVTCDDGFDNDGDTFADCADSNCAGVGVCEFPEATCDDIFDNDGDGLTDCQESSCTSTTWCTAETDCADTVDNDDDGGADCYDPGCDGQYICEYGAEHSCGDGKDNDVDELYDCEDPDCLGAFPCGLSCPPGQTMFAYNATAVPGSIVDLTTLTTPITVTGTGTVSSIAVEIDITHTYDGDLDISLTNPAGTSVDLTSDNYGANFTHTVFIDSTTTAITAGTAPYTGSFKPETALSTISGGVVGGTWNLIVYDDAYGDSGTLNSYKIAFCVAP
jgi:subtilisin-like proprotein convertase family protein